MSGYQKYKEQTVLSMSNIELLLLLYDEAISRLSKAEIAVEDGAWDVFEDCLRRATRIIRYLGDILDMSQKPLADDLQRIYDYLIYDISRVKAGRKRQKAEIGRIVHILSELRGAFDEASRRVNDSHYTQRKSVLG